MTRRAFAVLVVVIGCVVWSSGPSPAAVTAHDVFGCDDIGLVAPPTTLVIGPEGPDQA